MVSAATTAAPATTAVMALMIAITSPHALVLTVSHGSPVADSCLQRLLPRRFVHPTSNHTFQRSAYVGLDDPAGARPLPLIFSPDVRSLAIMVALAATTLQPRSCRGGACLSPCESLPLMRRKSDARSTATLQTRIRRSCLPSDPALRPVHCLPRRAFRSGP